MSHRKNKQRLRLECRLTVIVNLFTKITSQLVFEEYFVQQKGRS